MELKVKGVKCASSINKVHIFPLIVTIKIIITIICTFLKITSAITTCKKV